MKEKLNANVAFAQLPMGVENHFTGVVDLIAMQAYVWKTDDKDTPPVVQDVPADLRDDALLYRQVLVETLADFDDTLAEAVLADAKVTAEQINFALQL